MNELDLHGFTHDEGDLTIEDFVLQQSMDRCFNVESL